MPRPPKRVYDWQAIRDLVATGVTLREIAKTYQISYHSLCTRSYRERWNVMALRANLPKRSKTERKDENPRADLVALKNGVMLPLVKLANYYQSADLQTIREDQQRFMTFVTSALKVLAMNDAKQSEERPILNLTVLAARPAELEHAQIREAQQLPDSQSGAVEEIPGGQPSSREAKK